MDLSPAIGFYPDFTDGLKSHCACSEITPSMYVAEAQYPKLNAFYKKLANYKGVALRWDHRLINNPTAVILEIFMHSKQTRKVSERKVAGLHMLHTAIAKAKQEGRIRTKTRLSIK